MTQKEVRDDLYRHEFRAAMSQRYHLTMVWRWALADRAIRISVGVMSVLSVIFAARSESYYGLALTVAIVSVVISIFLNIVPFGERERHYSALYERWTMLRQQVQSVRVDLPDDEEAKVPPAILKALHRIVSEEGQVTALEPAPYPKLALKCFEDENEARWGTGIRTDLDVKAEKARRSVEAKESEQKPVEVS